MIALNRFGFFVLLALNIVASNRSIAADPPQTATAIAFPSTGLALPAVGRGGRNPIHTDALQALIARGEWKAPHAGDQVAKPDGGEAEWNEITADKDGAFGGEALNGGYLFLAVDSPEERVLLLDAAGHGMVYVNGEPRVGDVYQNGIVRLPVLLRKGANEFLFNVSRGKIAPKLSPPPKDLFIDLRDSTLPDLIVGETGAHGSVLIVNATNAVSPPLMLSTAERPPQIVAPGAAHMIPPLSTRKLSFEIGGENAVAGEKRPVDLRLFRVNPGSSSVQSVTELDHADLDLAVQDIKHTRKITFESNIDGSLQYYAFMPPVSNSSGMSNALAARPGLVFTLHGAGVEGIGQANSYAAKPDLCIVAPTNRRPFGFDWEDWGRLDALEVLRIATRGVDPRRVFLTGHSMGGHGTWQLGVTFPDKFAAIGPSAGWLSFWTYGMGQRREPKSAIEEILQRSTASSDTPSLMHNLQHTGVYILHGDKDDNVPVEQARNARDLLAEFHHDFELFEQPGAGHWWDAGHDAGTDCVDWQPMFDCFARHRLPAAEEVSYVDFTTMNPGVTADNYWATIYRQEKALKPSTIHIRRDAIAKRFAGTTENIAILALRLIGQGVPELHKPVQFELDDQTGDNKIEWTPEAGETIAWLKHDGGKWSVSGTPPPPAEKGPQRNGMFKDAFRNHMLFVYGTKGRPEENALQANKARYDAEVFWYRGNGSVDCVADTDLNQQSTAHRNLILYGNADTFAGWNNLVGNSPVMVKRGAIRIGDHEFKGDDLGLLMVRPRAGDDEITSVGIVSGTGTAGMRAVERMPYFMSGVAYPDCIVIGADALTKGMDGVGAAGFFGPDWSVERGEFAWSDR